MRTEWFSFPEIFHIHKHKDVDIDNVVLEFSRKKEDVF